MCQNERHIHNEYCNMPITLGACNSEAGTAARKFTLRYSVRPHPDTNVTRRPQHLLMCNIKNLCKCRSTTDCTDTSRRSYRNYRYVTGAMEKFTKYRTMTGIIRNPWPSKYYLAMNWIHITSGGMPICFKVIVLHCYIYFTYNCEGPMV